VTLSHALSRVLDAIDIETFLLCGSAEEARKIALSMLLGLGFSDADVVSVEMNGPGARVRARTYVHRPGARYAWLGGADGGDVA